MKKTSLMITLLLTLVLAVACGHGPRSGAPALNKILKSGELVVGTAAGMPPLNMTTKEGKIIGFEPDLAATIASGMGVTLRLEAMPFAELLPALESGKLNMVMSGMTITPDRNLRVAFVGPYFASGKAFLTKIRKIAEAENLGTVDSPDITLVALKGSTSQFFIEESLPNANLVTVDAYDEAVEMVLEDRAHALLADYPVCVVSLFRYPDRGLISMITPLTYEPIGIAVPAGDPLLLNWLENFFEALDGSGRLEELEERWLEDAAWMKQLP
jgi:polar amino acid transport system substrate-binding protein